MSVPPHLPTKLPPTNLQPQVGWQPEEARQAFPNPFTSSIFSSLREGGSAVWGAGWRAHYGILISPSNMTNPSSPLASCSAPCVCLEVPPPPASGREMNSGEQKPCSSFSPLGARSVLQSDLGRKLYVGEVAGNKESGKKVCGSH